jgi:hypothetical protein
MVNRWLHFKIHLISIRKHRFVPLLEITKQKSSTIVLILVKWCNGHDSTYV